MFLSRMFIRSSLILRTQVLSHLKEKLAFTEAETESEKHRLHDIEASLAKERDIVSRQKRVRDKIRVENVELEQKCGLIGKKVCLIARSCLSSALLPFLP